MKKNMQVQKDVMEELKSEPCVPSTEIEVAVKSGNAMFPRLAEGTVVRSPRAPGKMRAGSTRGRNRKRPSPEPGPGCGTSALGAGP